jgi:hypothetical protein
MLDLGYGMVVAGLSIGAPTEDEIQQTLARQQGILTFAAWFAGGGFALAALLRLWKTGVVHLTLVGLPLPAYVAWDAVNP